MPRMHYLSGQDLKHFPKLRNTMFQDRAEQFARRQNWREVKVDQNGWETDEYDTDSALYIIWELDDNTHGGSMRILPTAGKNMISDHFPDLIPKQYHNWKQGLECTRFLISPKSSNRATNALISCVSDLIQYGISEEIFGIFDKRMLRTYRRWKLAPHVYSHKDKADGWVALGGWRKSVFNVANSNNGPSTMGLDIASWKTDGSPAWSQLFSPAIKE